MDAIPANLCTLVEQLEDSRQFHQVAAQQSTGECRDRHHARSLTYAAMLSEISEWQSRNHPRVEPPFAHAAWASLHGRRDGYAALLDRVYRIHHTGAPLAQVIRMRTIGDAMDGASTDGMGMDGMARDGRRCAGESIGC